MTHAPTASGHRTPAPRACGDGVPGMQGLETRNGKELRFLYRVFSTGNTHYLYDAVTNRVFTISPALHQHHDVIFRALSGRGELSSFQDHPGHPALEKALGDVRQIVDSGLMKPCRLSKMSYRFPMEEYLESLEDSLHRMILEITEQCNLRCRYCTYSGHYADRRSHSAASMSFETAARAIDFLYGRTARSPLVRIDFFGGEPLLEYRKITTLVDYAEKLFDRRGQARSYEFTTNGTLLAGEVIDWLAALTGRGKLTGARVAVTLNGPGEIHDRHRVFRNGRGSHRVIMENLERFAARYPRLYREIVVFQGDFLRPEDLPEARRFFDTHPLLGGMQVTFNRVNLSGCDSYIRKLAAPAGIGESQEEEIRHSLGDSFRRELSAGTRGKSFLKSFLGIPLLKFHLRSRETLEEHFAFQGTCRPFLTRFSVKPDGSLHICERINDREGFGSVHRGLDREKLAGFLSSFRESVGPGCLTCPAVRFCALCFEHPLGARGYDRHKHLLACESVRESFVENLRAYCSLREEEPGIFDGITPEDFAHA